MESDQPDDLRALLRIAERAAAAPFIDYPPTPAWYAPAVGAWAATLAGVVAYRPEPLIAIVIFVFLLGLLGGFVGWYGRLRGTQPTITDAPPEFRRIFRHYLMGVIVLGVIVIPLILFAPPLAAIATTFVLVTGGIALYERAYARAAAATRLRLA
ncbi:hypothetical protein [Gordonia hydrophobica]|uniref:Transmembrane protein n=1 Tax=Gordonia hydrophobica TaxID=40516 RepID=A0ABZ2U2J1_9ACTN|nr:hypothetical protein [Gordonia hydrophobica]MBM7366912.1 hypothetical protein [Gordonia hydrophobica]